MPKISVEQQKLFPEINPIILQLLVNRGFREQSSIEEFFNFDYRQGLHNPFLFSDMKKTVSKIFTTIAENKKIVVYGDYDADGVCASVILVKTLQELGAKVNVYLPHRDKEGYGLNTKAIKFLAKEKTELLITVDCGISNYEEVVLANQLGLEVIITDHHHIPERLPPAFAILNPKVAGKKTYPFGDLAGVGVAFKLIQALVKHHQANLADEGLKLSWEGFEKWLLDLVAIGTVADCVPLLGENRILVKYGLTVLNKTRLVGLRELIKTARIGKNNNPLTTREISFQIAPRLNAAGRINHANNAFQLLITTSVAEAKQLAADLERDNNQRQRLTDKIIEETREQAESQLKQKLLFILGKDWPASLIGLVAGKFADEFNRPVIVVSEVDDKIVGSGRSISPFNIIEALEKVADCFSHFGGHAQACGFSLKEKKVIKKFRKKIVNLANRALAGFDFTPTLQIDTEINLSQIDWPFYQEISRFAPFGLGDPEPIFLTRNLSVLSHRQVGQNGKHLKLFIGNPTEEQANQMDGIGFNLADEFLDKIKVGDKIDLVYHLTANQWNGNEQLQLKMIDLKIIK